MSNVAFLEPIASSSQVERKNYQHISAEPINGALGAQISGLDLSTDLPKSAITEIKHALLDHQVIVFRDQKLNPEHLIALGYKFGKLHLNPFVQGLEGFPEIIQIKSEENYEKRFTGLWHSDISWSHNPSMGSLLYAVNVPKFGGDTLFANMYQAYDSLSAGMKEMLSALSAEHRVDRHHSSKAQFAETPKDEVIHPVICAHPQTGRKFLFVNEYFTTRFENMTEQESEPLLRYLFAHSVRPDFTCRIHWQPGTLVFWDNRCTMHYATNDYPGQSRLMHRVTIDGVAPIK